MRVFACLTTILCLLLLGCAAGTNRIAQTEGSPAVGWVVTGQEQAVPRWGVLHADQARTVSLPLRGVRARPEVLFDRRDTQKAAFSGTMVGPQHEMSLGVGGKLYRCLGPGPISFHPPKGIPRIVGFTSAVEVRHPRTGELLNRREFNLGLFTNFPAVDEDGFVYVPDWGRLQKFSPGLVERVWERRFPKRRLTERFAMVPAGSTAFLPDGSLLLPFLGGQLHVLNPATGATLFLLDLTRLDPPVRPDKQFGFLKIVYRNALTIDGDEIFVLVADEMIRLAYRADDHSLAVVERTPTPGFSSSTPTLDVVGKRLFYLTLDPDDTQRPPMLHCFDYSTVPMRLRWECETTVGFTESEDQLTATYLPTSGVILNNSLYGHVTAYIEEQTPAGPCAKRLWSTAETVSPRFAAYIAAASDADNTVYVTDNYLPRLYALDALTGKVLWYHDLPDRSIKTPIVAPGVVYLDHHRGLLALREGRGDDETHTEKMSNPQ